MRDSRPKNLNLFTIHFPAPAIASILHRISGVILILLLPLLILAFDYSLRPQGFQYMQSWASNIFIQTFFWLCLIPYVFHLVAGIRHLLADIHIGDSLRGGRLAAWLTFFITVILIILAGFLIW